MGGGPPGRVGVGREEEWGVGRGGGPPGTVGVGREEGRSPRKGGGGERQGFKHRGAQEGAQAQHGKGSVLEDTGFEGLVYQEETARRQGPKEGGGWEPWGQGRAEHPGSSLPSHCVPWKRDHWGPHTATKKTPPHPGTHHPRKATFFSFIFLLVFNIWSLEKPENTEKHVRKLKIPF